MFSRFSVYLKANNATCREELYRGLKQSFHPIPHVEHIEEVANIRDWFNTSYLLSIHHHTEPLHFKIALFKSEPTIYTKMSATQRYWSSYPDLFRERFPLLIGKSKAGPQPGFPLLKDLTPLFFSAVPPYVKKVLPDVYI